MNEQQLETIVAMLVGVQCSLVAVIDKLGHSDPAKREEMAQHLRATAANATNDPGLNQRAIIAMMINQVASGLESVKNPAHDPHAEIRRLLH